jgi:hypothetical protein
VRLSREFVWLSKDDIEIDLRQITCEDAELFAVGVDEVE